MVADEMAHYCYQCGNPIYEPKPHKRRKVRTGEVERRRHRTSRAFRHETRYGYRIVCGRCARAIDFSSRRLPLMRVLEAALLVLLPLIVALALNALS